MPRLIFTKDSDAIWISHLDLMRLFQRCFKRAGLKLTHTQGYNPRPSISIALPLSVGIASKCELLDFDLDVPVDDFNEIMDLLNNKLIEGIHVQGVYSSEKKVREIAFLESAIYLQFDGALTLETVNEIKRLFLCESIIVEKKTKNGPQEQDIKPLIKKLDIDQIDVNTLKIHVIHCCQNPALNPMLIRIAIEKYIPDIIPVYCRYERIEVYDESMNVFR